MREKILIIDDDNDVQKFLLRHFRFLQYTVKAASSGKDLNKLLEEYMPDIMLVDVVMPEINGFEICSAIKEDSRYRHIPVIFITGKDRSIDMLEGFAVGGVDYVTKPFNQHEISARVRAHLEFAQTNRNIKNQTTEIANILGNSEHQLAETEKLATLGLLSASIAHEIKNPTTFINGNVQTLSMFWNLLAPMVKSCFDFYERESNNSPAEILEPEQLAKLKFIVDEMPDLIGGMKKGVDRIIKICGALQNFAHEGQNEDVRPVNVNYCVEQALELCYSHLKCNVKIRKMLQQDIPCVMGNSFQIEQVLINLFINAADALADVEGAELSIETSKNGDDVKIVVYNNGPNIPEAILLKIWETFFTTKQKGHGTGLGLSISRGIIKEHGGCINVNNHENNGVSFDIILPAESSGEC